MPVGLILMKWDKRTGTEIVLKYPQEINISDQTLMQIYSSHEYSGEAGVITLMIGPLNITSYYTGPENGYYVVLLLNLDEDADKYEGGLADVARIILKNLENEAYVQIFPSLFRRISVYPAFNDEQILAVTYQDEIKRMIINRLREEGVFTKFDLNIWLKDKFKKGFFETDSLIIDLIKREIVKETSVKGMPSELLFFMNDILILRRPPINLLRNAVEKGLPEDQLQNYESEIKHFFQNYRVTEEDNIKIIEILINPQAYEVLRLLRTTIASRNDLEKLRSKGVEDINDALKALWECQVIHMFNDSHGNEYYALTSDIYVSLSFPKHILNLIKMQYNVKSKTNQVLIEYLNVLENMYYSIKRKKKALVSVDEPSNQ